MHSGQGRNFGDRIDKVTGFTGIRSLILFSEKEEKDHGQIHTERVSLEVTSVRGLSWRKFCG